MKDKNDQMIRDLLKIQFILNLSLIPLIAELYVLNLFNLLEHLFKLIISVSISIAIIKVEFDRHISEFHRFNQYILAMIFALITFLIIELLMEKNNQIFFILIILIILCWYVIHWIFTNETSPRDNK